MRCDECKHWKRQDMYTPEHEWGECQRQGDSFNDDSELNESALMDTEGERLFTRDVFGCVQYEAKNT